MQKKAHRCRFEQCNISKKDLEIQQLHMELDRETGNLKKLKRIN